MALFISLRRSLTRNFFLRERAAPASERRGNRRPARRRRLPKGDKHRCSFRAACNSPGEPHQSRRFARRQQSRTNLLSVDDQYGLPARTAGRSRRHPATSSKRISARCLRVPSSSVRVRLWLPMPRRTERGQDDLFNLAGQTSHLDSMTRSVHRPRDQRPQPALDPRGVPAREPGASRSSSRARARSTAARSSCRSTRTIRSCPST